MVQFALTADGLRVSMAAPFARAVPMCTIVHWTKVVVMDQEYLFSDNDTHMKQTGRDVLTGSANVSTGVNGKGEPLADDRVLRATQTLERRVAAGADPFPMRWPCGDPARPC